MLPEHLEDLERVIKLAEAYLGECPPDYVESPEGLGDAEAIGRVKGRLPKQSLDVYLVKEGNYLLFREVKYADGKGLPFREDGSSEDDVPF